MKYRIFILLFFLSLSGCSNELCKSSILTRSTSSDNKVDYVLLEKDCGATTSSSRALYVVPTGEEVPDTDPIFLIDKEESLRVYWSKEREIKVEALSGRIFKYKNFWHSKKVDDFKYIVDIKLSAK